MQSRTNHLISSYCICLYSRGKKVREILDKLNKFTPVRMSLDRGIGYIMVPVIIDSSVLIDAVVYVKPKVLERLISRYEAFIPVNVLEETLFKIIISVVGEDVKKNNLFEIKKAWIKGLGREEVENRFDVIRELIQNNLIEVLDLTNQIFNTSYLIIKKYGLFPNDALIAATCKHYGIKNIATFDSDFERVDFLDVVTV